MINICAPNKSFNKYLNSYKIINCMVKLLVLHFFVFVNFYRILHQLCYPKSFCVVKENILISTLMNFYRSLDSSLCGKLTITVITFSKTYILKMKQLKFKQEKNQNLKSHSVTLTEWDSQHSIQWNTNYMHIIITTRTISHTLVLKSNLTFVAVISMSLNFSFIGNKPFCFWWCKFS